MQISHVETFLTILETGNLNSAADRLNVTQSTVTTRINSLEAALGQRLLVRNRSGAQLTAAGFRFQRHAELLVESWRQAQIETALPRGFTTTCNIACHHGAWLGGGEFLFQALRDTCKDVAVALWPGEQQDLNRWLASGMVDVAITFDPEKRSAQLRDGLFEDTLLQVANVPRAVVRWDPGYIFVDHGPEFRRQHAATYPVDETPAVTFGSTTWALQHLLARGGSGYFPLRVVGDFLAEGKLHAVDGAPQFNRTCHLAFNDSAVGDWNWFAECLEQTKARIEAHLATLEQWRTASAT